MAITAEDYLEWVLERFLTKVAPAQKAVKDPGMRLEVVAFEKAARELLEKLREHTDPRR